MDSDIYLENFFTDIDPNLPDDQRLCQLQYEVEWYDYYDSQSEDGITLSVNDICILRVLINDKFSPVRKLAFKMLSRSKVVTWEDLELWGLDADEDFREEVIREIDPWGNLEYLLDEDPKRFVNILEKSAERYGDMVTAMALRSISEKNNQLLELTWYAADSLIDNADPNLMTSLLCGYFEHVIPDNNWKPDDPHICSWVKGKDHQRKCLLLEIAAYWGKDAGCFTEILQALAGGNDKEIASSAREILNKPN